MSRTRLVGPFVFLSLCFVAGQAWAADRSAQTTATSAMPARTVAIAQLDQRFWSQPESVAGTVEIADFPLGAEGFATLRLERIHVVTPRTRFVVGREQRPLAFNAEQVVTLRGGSDQPGVRAYLAISRYGSIGYVQTPSGALLAISSRDAAGADLPPGQLAVIAGPPAGNGLPDVPACGLPDSIWQPPPGGPPIRGSAPRRGLKQIELAIETDYEYFQLFGDLNAAAAYVVQLYGAVSDVYERDVHAEVHLPFVRLWDSTPDLFNEPDPLEALRDYWNDNMQDVQRDVVQFFSGRRDLPAGGVAYLRALCTDFGYSWTGYILGFFSDIHEPRSFLRDIFVTAHELGHNCSAPHTHDMGLDTCQDENSQPRRGTIMSYCGQTFTGGDANIDLGFHAIQQVMMRGFLAESACIADDCNRNGVPDGQDVNDGAPDLNADGIPDACEDCNNNSVLDPLDILQGAADRNGNHIPDTCETDCNANGVPDDVDLAGGATDVIFSDNFETDQGWTATSLGATAGNWERGVPVDDPDWQYDPASDSDGSGQCWLTQNAVGNTDVDNGATQLTSPVLDMSAGNLSIGYDYFLRLTETGGGVDRITVEGNSSGGAGPWKVLTNHASDGGLSWRRSIITPAMFAAAILPQTATMRFRFTINDANPQSIVEGGLDAFFVGTHLAPVSVDLNFDAVPDECQGDCDNDGALDYVEIIADMSLDLNRNIVLDSCEDCDGDELTDLDELDHSHNVWVADLAQPVLREYLADFGTQTATSAAAALDQAQDLLITPDRRVLVTSGGDNRVVEFTVDGGLVGDLVASGGGGLSSPGAMAISPAGTLLVASGGTNSVLAYDLTSGMSLGAFVASGSGGLSAPYGLAFGPNGNLYVGGGGSAANAGRVLEYDGASGAFVRVLVGASNGGLTDPHGLLFLPNGNLLVASTGTNAIFEYIGTSGIFVRQFSQVGTSEVLTFDQPWCLRLGPDGEVYATRSHTHDDLGGGGGAQPLRQLDGAEEAGGPTAPLHLTNARIYHFDVDSGWFKRAFIMGVNSGLENATGFDFVPDQGTDCNNNQHPDNCDIAAGVSADVNGNGVPDECETIVDCPGDVDSDGDVDLADLATLLSNFGRMGDATRAQGDLDGDLDVDLSDLATLLSNFGSDC